MRHRFREVNDIILTTEQYMGWKPMPAYRRWFAAFVIGLYRDNELTIERIEWLFRERL